MGTEMDPTVLRITLVLTFLAGCVVGYKAKEWRVRWTKRKRDVLMTQLAKTQKELEMLTIN